MKRGLPLALLLFAAGAALSAGSLAGDLISCQHESSPDPADEEALLEAEAYNRTLAEAEDGMAFLYPDTSRYEEYLALLASSTGSMGSVTVPSAGIHESICHGTEDETLEKGAGHLYGTSLPVGGESTHAVIMAHAGLPGKMLFRDLDQVKTGDSVEIRIRGRELFYEVDQIRTVLPEEMDELAIEPGADLVTLVTCTPYGVNTHRLLVRARRVQDTGERAQAFALSNRSRLMIGIWIVSAALSVLLLVITGFRGTIYELRDPAIATTSSTCGHAHEPVSGSRPSWQRF